QLFLARRFEQRGQVGAQLLHLLLAARPVVAAAARRLAAFERPGRQLRERLLGTAGVGVEVEEAEGLEEARRGQPLARLQVAPRACERQRLLRVVDQVGRDGAIGEDGGVGDEQHLAAAEQRERAEVLQQRRERWRPRVALDLAAQRRGQRGGD